MKKALQHSDVLGAIGIFVVSVPLLIYLFGAQFIRYMADDFCPIPPLSQVLNLDNSLDYVLSYPLRLAGVHAAPLVCILFLVAFWLVLFVVLRLVLTQTTFAALGASLFLGVLLAAAVNVPQSIYWQTGMLGYATPMILNVLTAWLILQRRLSSALSLVLCFLAVLLAGSTANAFAVAQVALFGALWVVFRDQPLTGRRLLVCAAGAGLTLLVALLLPGTQARFGSEATNPFVASDPSTLSRFLYGLERGFKDPLIYTLRNAPFGWAALVIIPFVAALFNLVEIPQIAKAVDPTNPRHRLRLVLAAIGAGALALGICMATWAGGYVAEGRLPTRVWIEGQYFLLAASAVAGYLLGLAFSALASSGQILARRYGVALVAILLVASAANVAFKAVPLVRQMRDYSVLADQRDAQLRSGALQVAELPSFGLNDVGVPWVDQCLQTYYNLPQPPNALPQTSS